MDPSLGTGSDDREIKADEYSQQDSSILDRNSQAEPQKVASPLKGYAFAKYLLGFFVLAVIVAAFNSKTDYCKDLRERYKNVPRLETQESSGIQFLPAVAVNIAYTSQDQSLPINPLRKNKEGKGIEDVLYKDEATRQMRSEFIAERARIIDSRDGFPGLHLAKYSLASSEAQQARAAEENERDWLRLEEKFRLSLLKEELPMCVVVPCFNNNAEFRVEASLNSIFTQNYSNYRVVIVDDASSDGSDALYRDYLAFHAIDKQRYTYVENLLRLTTLPNLYFAALNHCANDSVVLHVDGDDELIGRNVLQTFNWAYQTKKAGVVYSNFYWYFHEHSNKVQIWLGITQEYTDQQKKGNLYRTVQQKFSHQRSYRAELLYQIDPKDLQGRKGDFYPYAADQALMLPLMQLSCGRVHKIQGEVHYLYNRGKWNLNMDIYTCAGDDINAIIRSKKKYQCYKPFDERMKQ